MAQQEDNSLYEGGTETQEVEEHKWVAQVDWTVMKMKVGSEEKKDGVLRDRYPNSS